MTKTANAINRVELRVDFPRFLLFFALRCFTWLICAVVLGAVIVVIIALTEGMAEFERNFLEILPFISVLFGVPLVVAIISSLLILSKYANVTTLGTLTPDGIHIPRSKAVQHGPASGDWSILKLAFTDKGKWDERFVAQIWGHKLHLLVNDDGPTGQRSITIPLNALAADTSSRAMQMIALRAPPIGEINAVIGKSMSAFQKVLFVIFPFMGIILAIVIGKGALGGLFNEYILQDKFLSLILLAAIITVVLSFTLPWKFYKRFSQLQNVSIIASCNANGIRVPHNPAIIGSPATFQWEDLVAIGGGGVNSAAHTVIDYDAMGIAANQAQHFFSGNSLHLTYNAAKGARKIVSLPLWRTRRLDTIAFRTAIEALCPETCQFEIGGKSVGMRVVS